MAYTFKKFSDVEALTEVPDGANALVEVNGAIKRVPGSGLGGGGVKTAIIKSSNYDNAIAGVSTFAAPSVPKVTYSCINMTFEEAHQTMLDGDPLGAIFMVVAEGPTNLGGVSVLADAAFGAPCIILVGSGLINTELFWTADGISTDAPSSGK